MKMPNIRAPNTILRARPIKASARLRMSFTEPPCQRVVVSSGIGSPSFRMMGDNSQPVFIGMTSEELLDPLPPLAFLVAVFMEWLAFKPDTLFHKAERDVAVKASRFLALHKISLRLWVEKHIEPPKNMNSFLTCSGRPIRGRSAGWSGTLRLCQLKTWPKGDRRTADRPY